MSYYVCTRCGKPVERVDVGYRHARLSDYLGPCWWGRPYRYDHTDRFPEFTCHPDQRGMTADCGVRQHRRAANHWKERDQ